METPQAQSTDLTRCRNCRQPLAGKFCGNCGQEVKELRRPFFRLSAEAIHSLLELDGRAYRTLFHLLTKPAYLSREYFNGRRMRYTPPLRLFLVVSLSFFLFVSVYTSIQSLEGALNPTEEDSAPLIVGNASPSEQEVAAENSTTREEILLFVDQFALPFLSAEANQNLRRAMRAQAEANFETITNNPIDFARGYLEYITVFMLLMMPLLALILKIFYFRSGAYYSEHFVLTLHNHSFIIIVVFLASLCGMVEASSIPVANSVFGILGSGLYLWLWLYLYLSLKKYFQQGYGITLLKFITTTVLYGLALGFGVLVLSALLFFLF